MAYERLKQVLRVLIGFGGGCIKYEPDSETMAISTPIILGFI